MSRLRNFVKKYLDLYVNPCYTLEKKDNNASNPNTERKLRKSLVCLARLDEDKSHLLGKLPICGMWLDHEDIKDSVEWVNRLRADVQKREKELGLV